MPKLKRSYSRPVRNRMLTFIILHAVALVKISKHIIVNIFFLPKHSILQKMNFSSEIITDFNLLWGRKKQTNKKHLLNIYAE